MSYNPVAASNVKAEAKAYGILYAAQSEKHLRYSWILWAGAAGVILVLSVFRLVQRIKPMRPMTDAISAFCSKTSFFGRNTRTSRIQMAIYVGYILYNVVFSFADIPYGRSYRYTSKHAPGYVQTATTMQFIADRTGFLAFASVPLLFMLVSRNNVVTWLTGISYQHLNMLHRWVGRAIFVLTWVHTLLWTIEMGIHYDMEGGWLATRWRMRYWLGGFFATFFLCWLLLHSLAAVRRYTGYEFFRLTHNLGSILFLVGCWVHWPETFQWIAAGIALYYADRLLRWARLLYHYLRAHGRTQLRGEVFDDDDGVVVASIAITNPGLRSWSAGQHVYLYCIGLSEWEPHPFSVANCSDSDKTLRLVVRGMSGLTGELVNRLQANKDPIKILIDGPYGGLETGLIENRHVLLAVAGTGISFAISVLQTLASSPADQEKKPQIRLVWYVRRKTNVRWVSDELADLKSRLRDRLQIDVIISRELVIPRENRPTFENDEIKPVVTVDRTSIDSEDKKLYDMRCRESATSVGDVVTAFISGLEKDAPITVLGCGPLTFNSDVRNCVNGISHGNVRCYMDEYNI